jgi:aspartate/tyrosine/aromatic aminotransferase
MFFDPLAPMPQDPILSLTEQFRADPDPDKLDLGVGVYTDEAGNTPVLPSVLEGERRVLAHQQSKKYVGIAGDRGFCDLHQVLTFGADHPARRDGRIVTIQTPGGSGGLRVAAELIGRAREGATVWVSDPTWANHMPLLGAAGLALRSYPYYDAARRRLDFEGMLNALSGAGRGDVVLLHGCCHNPTGEDLDAAQWAQIGDLMAARDLLPFVDLAYQGFGEGVEADVAGLRGLASRVPELVAVSSCSKNFSLYRERAGSLSVVCAGRREADVVASNLSAVARSMYSMPPHHGAGIVAEVLGDPALSEQWHGEVQAVCERIQQLRSALVAALHERMPSRDFSFLARQRGMFSLLGIPGEAIERLRADFHVYVVGSSRVNIAGLATRTINRFADALAAVLDS